MTYSGQCTCGSVKYEALGEPLMQCRCHCTHCQRMTGSAFSATMVFQEQAVSIQGEPKLFDRAGESGKVHIFFCSQCGSQLFVKPISMPGTIGIRAGTLNNAHDFKPSFDIFARSAVPWNCLNSEIPRFDTYPP